MSNGERIDLGRLIQCLRQSDDGFARDDAFDMAIEFDQSYSAELPVLFSLVESSDPRDSGLAKHFALKAILAIDPLGEATEALVRRLALDSKDEPIKLEALEALGRYGRRWSALLASIIRRRHQTLMVRLVALYFLSRGLKN